MTTVTSQQWLDAIQSIQNRNGIIQVTSCHADPQAHSPATYRSRMLACDELGFLIEPPSISKMAAHFTAGTEVSLLCVEADQRWDCQTTIRNVERFRLNTSTELMALRLAPPRDVRSAQQRKYFRVDITASTIEPVLLVPVASDELSSDEAKTLPKIFSAPIINISGGGIGVEAPAVVAKQLADVSEYRCTLMLPNRAEPFEMPARVVHAKPLEDGSFYLGLEFDTSDPKFDEESIDHICRFATWYQRQALQRRRDRQ